MTSSPTPAVLPDARALVTKMIEDRKSQLSSCERMLELLQPEWEKFEARTGHDTYVARDYADHTSAARKHRKEIAALEALLATPPAPDAAVPVRHPCGCEADPIDGLDYVCDRHLREGGSPLAAAPKVASDTGAGLREAQDVERLATALEGVQERCRKASAQFNADKSVPSVRQMIALDSINGHASHHLAGIELVRANARALATPTDATDGATGGGEVDLWSDEIERFVEAGFATVSRNPNDHETVVAYRRAIAIALATTPGGDLLEQAARSAKTALERFANAPILDGPLGKITGARDAIRQLDRAISARNQTDGGEK
jgi:hypothetical protein